MTGGNTVSALQFLFSGFVFKFNIQIFLFIIVTRFPISFDSLLIELLKFQRRKEILFLPTNPFL